MSKYGEYLASRQWALKREAVKERSGGICERCHKAAATEVHHRDYSNLYNEPLTDLQHVCHACHMFESGLTNIDPAEPAPGPINEREWREKMQDPFFRQLLGLSNDNG